MQKRWVRIALGIVAIFVIVLVLVPLFVNADTFRPTIQSELSSAMGRQITLGHLSFSLLSGSLVANDISIADDPAFSSSPFLQAKALKIGVEVMPLLFNRQVHITHLTVDTPAIQLIHAANGLWNFSSIGGSAAKQPAQTTQPSALPDLTVAELKITKGSATVSSLPSNGKSFTYSDLTVTVQQFSFLKNFPFELSAQLPASGSFDLKGNAGPLNQSNAADTPFHATLGVKHFDPVAAGVLDSSTGMSMILDVDAQMDSNGASLTTNGKMQAAQLHLARAGSPAKNPVNIDFAVSDNLASRTGNLSNLAIHSGQVAAHITGGFHMTPQAMILNLKLAAPDLPIDQVEELLPAFGVVLPSGSQLHGGTLSANLNVTGPVSATTITGPVDVENTTLAGYDIGSKIQGLNLFKSGNGTQIQTVRTTVSSSPSVTQFNDIYGNLPQIGTATGNGTMSPSGAINFTMTATLSSNNAVGAVANQAMNTVHSFVGGFLHPNQKPAASNSSRGIPLTITGTASSPSIRANVMSMLK